MVPPPFKASLAIKRKRIRYETTAAVDIDVSAQDLATLLGVALNATTIASIINAVQLRTVEIWSPPTTGANVAIEFAQENTTFIGSPSSLVSDTCMSMTKPAHIKVKPPKNSLSGFWIAGGATSTSPVVSIIASENSIIDFVFDLHLIDTGFPQGQTRTVAGATVGGLYLKTLGTGQLIPVSFPGL